MNAVVLLAIGFGAIILVGTILTALHDAVAAAAVRRSAVGVTSARPSRWDGARRERAGHGTRWRVPHLSR